MAQRKDGTRRGAAPLRIIANKNRTRQVAPTRRKLFGKKARDAFLEWFAATCNCSLAARKIGFHYRTVIRHWREDADFGARCEEALRIGYVRLEELALREAEAALKRKRRPSTSLRTGPIEGMDAAMALQLLREHKRGLAGGGGRGGARGGGSGPGGKPGRAPAAASNAEVFDALVKRLRAFGIRIGKDGNRQ